MKKVVAIKDAFYQGSRIRKGTEFQVEDGVAGKWFVDADKYQPAPFRPPAAPTTFSQIARSQPAPPPTVSRGRRKAVEAPKED